eukprot:6763875-Prymnesium_polylepis.1
MSRASAETPRSCASIEPTNIEAKVWWRLASIVPCSDSDGDVASRKKIFTKMDGNGNGFLTITEVERYLRKMLGAREVGELADRDQATRSQPRTDRCGVARLSAELRLLLATSAERLGTQITRAFDTAK